MGTLADEVFCHADFGLVGQMQASPPAVDIVRCWRYAVPDIANGSSTAMVRQALLLHMKLVIVVPLTDSTPIKTFTAADVEIVVPLPVADPLNMCLVPVCMYPSPTRMAR